MIYEKSKFDDKLLKPNDYLIAEKDIEIKNLRDSILVISRGTVFTVESRYMTNVFEVVFRTYGFNNTIAKYGNLIAVQKVHVKRFSEDEYNVLVQRLRYDTDCMEKTEFERKLLEHSEVRKSLGRLESIKNQLSVSVETARGLSNRQKNNNFADTVIKDAAALAERIENDPTASKLYAALNIGIPLLCFYSILKMLLFSDVFLGELSIVVLVADLILIVGSMVNLFSKPVKAFEVNKIFLKSVLYLLSDPDREALTSIHPSRLSVITGVNGIPVSDTSLEIASVQRELVEHFSEIAFDIFVSAKLQQRSNAGNIPTASPIHQNGMPAISPLTSPFASAPPREVETRTEQEIVGGYERVAFPRYKSDNVQNTAQNGRGVINLDKNASVSGRKKVDLEKAGDRPMRKEISLTKKSTDMNDVTDTDAVSREKMNINRMFM